MFPLQHIIFSTIFCLILYPFIGLNTLVVWVVSIFIDVDHYFWYIINQKSWNLLKAYKKCKNKEFLFKYRYMLHIFHLNELLIIIGLLSFFSIIFFYIFIGMLFHYILDWIHMYMHPETKKLRSWSLIMYIKRKLRI